MSCGCSSEPLGARNSCVSIRWLDILKTCGMCFSMSSGSRRSRKTCASLATSDSVPTARPKVIDQRYTVESNYRVVMAIHGRILGYAIEGDESHEPAKALERTYWDVEDIFPVAWTSSKELEGRRASPVANR